jgi:hypothetical protein
LEIVFSDHFLIRKRLRQIPDGLAESIFRNAEEHYEDRGTGTYVAVKRMHLYGRVREVALVYTRKPGRIILITLHPLKEGQKERRIKSGRWVKV